MDRTVEGYLAQLRSHLAGADPAVVQDAVYDAEEYLRDALAEEGTTPEAFDRVVEAYGRPEEIASAYLETELTVAHALRPAKPAREQRSALGRFFGVIADPAAWGSLFYMALTFGTGIVYFTVVVTGLSLTAGLMPIAVGALVGLLLIGIVRAISLAEGRMVEGLLGVRMPRRPRTVGQRGDVWERLKTWFTDWRTWTTMIYMVLQLPVGIVYFSMLVTAMSLSAALVALPVVQSLADTPVIRAGEYGYLVEPWAFPLVMGAGLLGLLLTLWLAKGVGRVHGAYAKGMLVGGFTDTRTESVAPVARPVETAAGSAATGGDES